MSPPTASPDPAAIEVLHRYVLETVGPEPANWPGRWPDELEVALIDAVFSVRARYGNRERKTGVFGAVTRWREHRGKPANDLRVLAATSPDALRSMATDGKVSVDTRQKSSSTPLRHCTKQASSQLRTSATTRNLPKRRTSASKAAAQ